MEEYIALALLALFIALIPFSIILNMRDMKWFVDFTEADAKEKFLSLKLDSAEIRRYRRRRQRFGRFGGSESLTDFVEIPLDAHVPLDAPLVQIDATSNTESSALKAAKAIAGIAKGTALLSDQHDLLVVFGKKGGKEHRVYSCDFTKERLELAKEITSLIASGDS